VSATRRAFSAGCRVFICALLLFWICHSIFTNEARSAWERRGLVWGQLTWPEQWKAVWSVGPSELWRTVRTVNPLAMAASVVCMGFTLLIGMVRWRLVMGVHGFRMSFRRVAEISLVAHFFNSFLLGSTGGDLLKSYYAARETHHKKPEAVVTVFVDRMIGLFSMLLFASVMMIPNRDVLFGNARLAAVNWLILAMLVVGGVVFGAALWGGVSRTWPGARRWLRRLPWGETLDRALEACRLFGRSWPDLLKALAWSMVLNTVCVLQILCLAKGLGLSIPWLLMYAVVPVVICVSALPITPSGLGLRENLYVLMLAAPGIAVPATQSLSLSLLAYAGSLAWSLIGGLVYLAVRDSDGLADLAQEASHSGE
jgi:uncharacterized membrane protein YbhN (UPF0104 family)